MRNIFLYGSPCVSSNCLFSCLLFHNSNKTLYISMLNSNGFPNIECSDFTSHTNCIYLLSLTHDLPCEYPHYWYYDIISHTHSTFLVYIQGLHCVFPNHGCFEIISHTNCINLSLAHGLKYGLPNHWYYENASQTEFMCNSCNTLVHAPCLSKSGCISDECFLK